KAIQPSTLAFEQVASTPELVLVLKHTPARWPRRMASIRATCRLAINSLAAAASLLPLITDWKLGTAIDTTMAATARVTISSITVKPRARALDMVLPTIPRRHSRRGKGGLQGAGGRAAGFRGWALPDCERRHATVAARAPLLQPGHATIS